MSQRRSASLVLVASTIFAACGSSGGSDAGSASATVDGAIVAVGAAPFPGDGVGSIGDAVEVAAGAPGDAADVACTIDRQTIETAVEAYEVLNGTRPTTQQELMDAQMIRELSVSFEVDADGVVVPVPGSPCN